MSLTVASPIRMTSHRSTRYLRPATPEEMKTFQSMVGIFSDSDEHEPRRTTADILADADAAIARAKARQEAEETAEAAAPVMPVPIDPNAPVILPEAVIARAAEVKAQLEEWRKERPLARRRR